MRRLALAWRHSHWWCDGQVLGDTSEAEDRAGGAGLDVLAMTHDHSLTHSLNAIFSVQSNPSASTTVATSLSLSLSLQE